jgi:hypothetical protein
MDAYLAEGAPAPEAGVDDAESTVALDIDWSTGWDAKTSEAKDGTI